MNAGEKAAAYVAKFKNPQARIATMRAAVDVMCEGKDHPCYDEAVNFLCDAIAYYTKTDVYSDGMTLEDWIVDGDWTGKISTAKQLAADYDAR